MYLSENKTLRMVTLCGLYVAQGVPWGFVTVTFAAWLAVPEHNLTTEQIGPILAVATLPWSFKFLWGPLMDWLTIPSLGRRRPWILFAQSMAILVLGSFLFFDDLPRMVWTTAPVNSPVWEFAYRFVPGPLAAMILVANVFISVQDVAVDALAVDLLDEDERGIANGLMYGSSYLGTAIGGAGLGWVVGEYGIRAGLIGQAAILFVIMLLPLLLRERRLPAHVTTDSSNTMASANADSETPQLIREPNPDSGPDLENSIRDLESLSVDGQTQDSIRAVFLNLFRAFSLRATILGAVVALGTKIGIGILTAVFVNYLMKDGGWSQQDYTTVMGGSAVIMGLAGSAIGGFLADRFGPKPMIILSSILLGGAWIAFGVVPSAIESRALVSALLMAQEFLFGVLAVSLFTMFMTISWPRVAATQFTTYMALMNLSATFGHYAAGQVGDVLTIFQILAIAGILQIVMVAPVLFIDPAETRRVLGNE